MFISTVFFVFNGVPLLGDALGFTDVSSPSMASHPSRVMKFFRIPGTITHLGSCSSLSLRCPA